MYAELSKNADILPHFGGHPDGCGHVACCEDVIELREQFECAG